MTSSQKGSRDNDSNRSNKNDLNNESLFGEEISLENYRQSTDESGVDDLFDEDDNTQNNPFVYDAPQTSEFDEDDQISIFHRGGTDAENFNTDLIDETQSIATYVSGNTENDEEMLLQ